MSSELNFKLAIHYTKLGKYTSVEKLQEHVEGLVEELLERELSTEVGVNITVEDTPTAFFSCIYVKEDEEIIIPFATKLRGKEAIGEYQADYGYAPDDATLEQVYSITEHKYNVYSRNRHDLDPMKSEYGSNMKYYRLLKGEEVVTIFGSKRKFKKDEAIIAHAMELGKITDSSDLIVEAEIDKADYVKWKYGVSIGKKNKHYVVKEEYTDGRDTEYLATLATKINFTDNDQVKKHLIEIGKLKANDFEDSNAEIITVNFREYGEAKKVLEQRNRVVKQMSESEAEAYEYTDEEIDDDWNY